MVPTQLLLLRHGQSEWNAEGRWQGLADPPLSDLGRQQALLATRRLGMVDDIVSSDLQRAAQTAELIAGELGVGPVLLDQRLRERDAGSWTGLTKDDINERWPDALTSGARPEGYEPDESVLGRVMASLSDIVVRSVGGQVLVVVHGGVIRAVERFLGSQDGVLPNLGGRWLTAAGYDPGQMQLGERVLLLDPNEISVTTPNHL